MKTFIDLRAHTNTHSHTYIYIYILEHKFSMKHKTVMFCYLATEKEFKSYILL